MQREAITAALVASILLTWLPTARAAGSPPPGTFDYIAHQRICVIDRCQTADAPGRITVLKSGKILVYFANVDRTGLEPNGVLLELGRSVNLSGRGRLPATVFGGLTPQRGSGSAQFDGRRLILTVNLTGSGPQNGGSATVSGRFANILNLDPSTGSILGGSGQVSGTVQGVSATGQPFSGPLSGSATIEGR